MRPAHLPLLCRALTTTPHNPRFFSVPILFSWHCYLQPLKPICYQATLAVACPRPAGLQLRLHFSMNISSENVLPPSSRQTPPGACPVMVSSHAPQKNIPQLPIRPMPLITFFFAIAISTNQPPNMAGAIFAPAKSRAFPTTPHSRPFVALCHSLISTSPIYAGAAHTAAGTASTAPPGLSLLTALPPKTACIYCSRPLYCT